MEMNNCTHYFMIPAPNGPTSIGVCKLCGVKREMVQSTDSIACPIHKDKRLALQRQVALKATEE